MYPKCLDGRIRIVAFITEADTLGKILAVLDLPTEPPCPTPARRPPQEVLEFACAPRLRLIAPTVRSHFRPGRVGEFVLKAPIHQPELPSFRGRHVERRLLACVGPIGRPKRARGGDPALGAPWR